MCCFKTQLSDKSNGFQTPSWQHKMALGSRRRHEAEMHPALFRLSVCMGRLCYDAVVHCLCQFPPPLSLPIFFLHSYPLLYNPAIPFCSTDSSSFLLQYSCHSLPLFGFVCFVLFLFFSLTTPHLPPPSPSPPVVFISQPLPTTPPLTSLANILIVERRPRVQRPTAIFNL